MSEKKPSFTDKLNKDKKPERTTHADTKRGSLNPAGRPKIKNKATEPVVLRFTPEQKQKLVERAEAQGVSVAGLIKAHLKDILS